MQAVMVMFRSDGERRSFSITRDMTVVGRREDCDLRIPLGDVSRKHCRLVRDGDTLRLEDLGSSNGTYHNGQRVDKEAILQPGDSVQVGPVIFVLQVDGIPADEDLHPVSSDGAVPSQYADQGAAGAGGATVDEEGYAEAPPLPEYEALPETEALPEAEPLPELEELSPEAEPLAELEELSPEAEPLAELEHAGSEGGVEPLDGLEALEPLEPLPLEGHDESLGHNEPGSLDIHEGHEHLDSHGSHGSGSHGSGDELPIDFDSEHPQH